ncbi:MAG: protein phosphatase CheZ [Kiloniellales bacterium]
MSKPEASRESELGPALEALAAQVPGVDPKSILEIVQSVMGSIHGDASLINVKLFSEIESLAQFITNAKAEIAEIRPDDIKNEHLPTATDELSAIVGSTETATNSILEAMEVLEGLAGGLEGEVAEKISDAVTKVYEACNFQDITGQRITKVVKALQHVETKVTALLVAFGHEAAAAAPKSEAAAETTTTTGKPARPDENLMSGPQLPENSTSQEDIDALFASLG